ncbi:MULTISPECIES: hypothetical protein [Nocardioides]|uniref:Uncharacterized protein n=1 Tax=Nocardioides abyssi TaxID=3058370 RepID=A0ABT8ET41_9ACTN|nr:MULTISPECIES: hypothetical protein [Nocardioides]MDF9717023.1 hypothetical protein [Nocardioides sp. ChNu-99]MDN4161208.1 hypothetical protein [Nocardioides abyssi]MDN7121529.1 hypothetical protein [Nocardioides sp. ChNu-153]
MLNQALPIWAVRVLTAVLALALFVLTVAVALLLPHIPRLVRAASDMPAALEVVDRAPDTLDQVERIDRNVESLTPPVATATEDLSAVAPHIETLAGQINQLLDDLAALQRTSKPLGEAAPKIAALSGQLEGLQTSLRRLDRDLVEPLTEVRRPMRRLADTAGPLPESLERLNRSTAVLEQLPGYFDRLQRILVRVARHVRNLDEKTGPNLW